MQADRATPQHADPLYDLPLEQRCIGRFLRLRAAEDGDRPYLTFGAHTYTFAATEKRCRELARGLAQRGIRDGSRVLLMLPNCAEFVFAWYACSLLGAAIVPLNTNLKGLALEALVEDAQADAVIVKDELLPALDSMRLEFRRLIPWLAVVGVAQDAGQIVERSRVVHFDELYVAEGADPEIAADYRRIQFISYTSGTTGPSKGVMLPNALTFSSACTFMRLSGMTRDDILYSPLPLFHGLSSRMCALPALVLGAHAVIGERFSASRYWEQAATCNATLGYIVHAVVALLKAQPPGVFDRAHRVRAIFNVAHDLEFEARFGVRTLEAFAMTETSYLLYTPYTSHAQRTLGSTGRAHEDWDIELVDDNDVPVPLGRPGELVGRPRKPYIVMQGYLNRPQATLDAWRNLWFHTGDILRRDEDGNFFYIDRKHERIRRRGENVSSSEIERGVLAHPAIAECVVIAHPASTGEDDIRLVAVLKDGAALAPAELFAWLLERLPKFMMPRYVEFRDALPRTGTNKVEKHRLVQNNDVRECFADEVTLAADRVVRVPPQIRLTDIAGFSLNFGTSYYALAHRAKLAQGETLAVHGASGGVGLAAVKLGKMLGATVIATGGDDEKLRAVKAEGADFVVNTLTEPLAERIRELTGGRGADVSFDPVGGDVFDAAMRSTAIDGRILVVGFASGRIPSAPANKVLFGGLSVVGAPYGGFTRRNPERWAELMSALVENVRSGVLKPLIHRRFTFGQAPEALAMVRDRKVIGKCIMVSDRGLAEEP